MANSAPSRDRIAASLRRPKERGYRRRSSAATAARLTRDVLTSCVASMTSCVMDVSASASPAVVAVDATAPSPPVKSTADVVDPFPPSVVLLSLAFRASDDCAGATAVGSTVRFAISTRGRKSGLRAATNEVLGVTGSGSVVVALPWRRLAAAVGRATVKNARNSGHVAAAGFRAAASTLTETTPCSGASFAVALRRSRHDRNVSHAPEMPGPSVNPARPPHDMITTSWCVTTTGAASAHGESGAKAKGLASFTAACRRATRALAFAQPKAVWATHRVTLSAPSSTNERTNVSDVLSSGRADTSTVNDVAASNISSARADATTSYRCE